MGKILIYTLCLIITFIKHFDMKVTEQRNSDYKFKLDKFELENDLNININFNKEKQSINTNQELKNLENSLKEKQELNLDLSLNTDQISSGNKLFKIFKSLKPKKLIYEKITSIKSKENLLEKTTNKINHLSNNEATKILEIYPAQSAPGFTIDLVFGSTQQILSLYLDIFNSYSYILSQNMKNETFNYCAQLFDYYDTSQSTSYKKDTSKTFNSKIFIRDFNFTGTPSLDEAYLDVFYLNKSKLNNFAFYLVENIEVKYNKSKCLAIFGGLGLGFSNASEIGFLDQLKRSGVIEQKVFALLLPLQSDNTYLHLGGFKKEWVNDTAMINWVDVKLNDNNNDNAVYFNYDREAGLKKSKESGDNGFDYGGADFSIGNLNGFYSAALFDDLLDEDENGLNYNDEYNKNNNIVNSNNILNKLDYKSPNNEKNNNNNNNSNNHSKYKIPFENLIYSSSSEAATQKASSMKNNNNLENLIYLSAENEKENKLKTNNSKLNWHLTANKIYLRKEIYEAEHKIAFNTLSESITIPKKFFFDNYKNIFGSETDCKIEQDGFFYCKCYPYYSENFPVINLEFNSKFNITISPQDYVQIIINYSDDDVRPCRLLLKLNYSDDYWELGVYVLNNFYLIFNQETNKLGFFDRKFINQIDNDQAMLLVLIVSLGSIILFLIVYCLFKKYVDRNNEDGNNNNNNNVNNNPAQRNLI